MSETKDTVSKTDSKGKKTGKGKTSSSGKKGSFFSRFLGKKSTSSDEKSSGASKGDLKSVAKKTKSSTEKVKKEIPQIEGKKTGGGKFPSSETDTAGKEKQGTAVPPRESAKEKEPSSADTKREKGAVDSSRSDSSVAVKSEEKTDQGASPSPAEAKPAEGRAGEDSHPQQVKQKEDTADGKDISAEKGASSGKDVATGTGASGGKDASSGKDVATGKDASGKDIPGEKDIVSNMKKEDPATKAGPETGQAEDSKKQPTSGEITVGGADPENRAKDSKKKSTLDPSPTESVELQGLFAFKLSMTTFYDEKGTCIPVTALKYKPWIVSQIKTKEKEGYTSVQLACHPQKNKRRSRAQIKHLAPAGFKEGARYVREIRQELTDDIQVGRLVSITGIKKGDRVKISSRSKGRGFSGVVKRWGFHGGRASHGSKTHRTGGAIGQHTEPARVMPGRKMAGRYGFQKTTLHSVPVVDVLPEEGLIFVKGPVPGARNTLVSLEKTERSHA